MKEKPNRITELRRSNGISQEKLAEELNVTQASVSLYENGSNIPPDILVSIAKYFDVTLEYLLKLSDDRYNIPIDAISDTEYNILLTYRKLPQRQRDLVDKLIKTVNDRTVEP